MTRFGFTARGLGQWLRSHVAAEAGMTVSRSNLLLGLIVKDVPVSMSEFGAEHDLSPRSMTVLVDGLEERGLVRRIPHDHDRRVTLVELTEAGRDVAVNTILPAKQEAASLFDELTPTERDDLVRLLDRMAALLAVRGITVPSINPDGPGNSGR